MMMIATGGKTPNFFQRETLTKLSALLDRVNVFMVNDPRNPPRETLMVRQLQRLNEEELAEVRAVVQRSIDRHPE